MCQVPPGMSINLRKPLTLQRVKLLKIQKVTVTIKIGLKESQAKFQTGLKREISAFKIKMVPTIKHRIDKSFNLPTKPNGSIKFCKMTN